MHAAFLPAALTTAATAQCPIVFSTTPTHTPNVPNSHSTVAADFDGDGRMDLATVDQGGPFNISVLWGRGDGTFEPRLFISGGGGFGLTAGDLDEDGRPDLLFTPNSGSIALDAALFHTDRTFTLHPNAISRTGLVGDLTLADLDGDGHLDAAFVTLTGTIGLRLARGTGQGGFTPGPFTPFTPPDGHLVQTLLAPAIRSPSEPDLLITTTGPGATRILTARFRGWDTPAEFTDARDLARSHTHAAAPDLDLDGHADLILDTFANASGGVSTFPGLADGTFGPERYTPAGPTQPLGMAAADLDGDGRAEVVITNPTFTVFRNTGPDGLIPTFYDFNTLGGRTLSIADFDRDGRPDLALTTTTPRTADIVLNAGPLPFVRPAIDPIYTCPGSIAEARITTTRFANPVSWEFLAPSGWTTLPEGGALTTPTGEPFGTASNTDQTTLRIAVAQGCCFASHTALIRGLASTACGTTHGPPIALIVCRADFTCDGFLDFFDYDGFVQSFLDGDPTTDFNNDGFLDFFDYDDFVASFETGC